MTDRRLRMILFFAVTLTVMAVYLYSVAPTASFWDCGEFIAVSYIAGVPHPPGTPLFVMIGRLFSLLPIGREIAFRINLIPVVFGAISCGLMYLIVVKLISIYAVKENESYPWLRHLAGLFAGLTCGFAYSYWDNCVEAEVYAPCVVVALGVLYLALVWRDGVEKGTGDNRQLLAAMFLLFLSAGIHFTPMLTVFAILIFALVVDREAVIQLRFFELWAGFMVILTMQEIGLGVGSVLVAVIMLLATYWGIQVMQRSKGALSILYGLGLLFVSFVVSYVTTGGRAMDDVVLFIASPTVAFIERWVKNPWFVIVFVLGFAGYLYWRYKRQDLRPKFVALMLGLVFLAGSVQFIMMIRARHRPSINEVEPSRWREFVSVLKREQYDPMRLFPRKTQFLTEEEWRQNINPAFGLFRAYLEQVAFYLRYFFWQWGNERYFDMLITNIPHVFLRLGWQGLLGLIPPILGIWGMVQQFKKDRRSFVLIFVAFLVASVGLLTYLNLKFSPSDPRPHLKFREVRERDYFFAFSFVFYAIFVGVGAYAFLRWLIDEVNKRMQHSGLRRLTATLASAATLAYGFVPMFLNYQTVTRKHNWIPAEYGYNMLVSCPGEHAVVFTNGDNDTFPLWFMQTVPSLVANNDPNFGKNVAVANLSLLNTNWYCKQLKRWGAPISFTEAEIDRLPQGFVGKRNRTVLMKDIMIRNIVATAGGVKLKWPQDYESTPEEFMAKVFGPGYQATSPVYFATTVSPDNLVDVQPYLSLEGLVRRVVPVRDITGEGQVNVARTYELLTKVYRMNSMLDPRVQRDENTQGLLTNYAHSYLMLAFEFSRQGNYAAAQNILEPALRFDLPPSQKTLLYYNMSRFATLNRDFQTARQAIDSADFYGRDEPRLTLELLLQRGFVEQSAGEFAKAEEAYLKALALMPDRFELVNLLLRMYLDDMRDTARARTLLSDWLRRHPQDSQAARLFQEISQQ